jgi:hypothetical protein
VNWPDFFAGAFFATLTAGSRIQRICIKQVKETQRVADYSFKVGRAKAREKRVLRKHLEALERNKKS